MNNIDFGKLMKGIWGLVWRTFLLTFIFGFVHGIAFYFIHTNGVMVPVAAMFMGNIVACGIAFGWFLLKWFPDHFKKN